MNVLQPLRELGTPLADISQPMPFTAVQSMFDPFFPRQHFQSYWKSTYLSELSNAAIDVIAQQARERPSPLSLVITFLWGGAIDASAPGTRRSPSGRRRGWCRSTGTGPIRRQRRQHRRVRQAWSEVAQFGTGSTYLNFTGIADERTDVGVDSAFGRTSAALRSSSRSTTPTTSFGGTTTSRPPSNGKSSAEVTEAVPALRGVLSAHVLASPRLRPSRAHRPADRPSPPADPRIGRRDRLPGGDGLQGTALGEVR